MKAAAFNDAISYVFTTPLKTVTTYARFLKEAGLLTTGARGRNAPDMSPLDAARMTIALLTTTSPSQCVERVKRFGAIPFSPTFKKTYRDYETISRERFEELFEGDTLEDVLAYLFSIPQRLDVEEACKYFDDNVFHLRISDFDVLAELFQWKMEDSEIVGELVVPFKGKTMVRTDKGFKPIKGWEVIKGGIRTERSCSSTAIFTRGHFLTLDEIGVKIDE